MASTLTWLDHDAKALERMRRVIAAFDQDTRDELGLGGVRDSIADQLFPGTSTIQTRLRYMLFVPWMYVELEKKHVESAAIARRARDYELRLSLALLKADDKEGVIGKRAGRSLKRLPSSVYWSGLGAWGIRRFPGSQDQYHAALDGIYRRRKERRDRDDDNDVIFDSSTTTWHRGLPDPPEGFPDQAELRLTRREAQFLEDRIVETQSGSLLAHLALRPGPLRVNYAWGLSQASLSAEHRELLYHARLFSETMHGASILYNLMLAQELRDAALVDYHREALDDWTERLNRQEVKDWPLKRLWELTLGTIHVVSPHVREFVARWVRLVLEDGGTPAENDRARDLIRRREMQLKGPRSRFVCRDALDRWRGQSMASPLSYRWSTARTFLEDLHAGLRRR